MTKKRFIKPAKPGLLVRQPHNGQPLPGDGAWVSWSGHWVRRKAEGSIVEASAPKKPKAKPAAQVTDQKESD